MHVLQTTLLPASGLPAALYLRLKRRRATGAVQFRPDSAGLGITLDKGDTLSTDTFFGSFYASYWAAFTDVSTVSAVVAFRGRGQVRVFEDTGATSGAVLLAQYELDAPVTQRFLIQFAASGMDAGHGATVSPSRIYVEIEAEQACAVQAIDFVTEQAAQREVRLSVGISTFNDDQSQIASLLPAVLQLAEADPSITTVHLVNHGAPLTGAAAVTSAKLRQSDPAPANAPGGMAQTLAAARSADDGATHHLLLSDDLHIDARLVLRAVEFLRYASTDMIVGGAVLDAQRPTELLGAGAVIGATGQFQLFGKHTDLTKDAALQPFSLPDAIDLPCWWYCVLPLDPATRTALPQRPFRRGDDYAYYLDQTRQGVSGICLPGIGAWRDAALVLPAQQAGARDGVVDLNNRYLPPHRPPVAGQDDAAAAADDQDLGQMHVLQAGLFPADDLPEALYLRVTPARPRGGLLPRATPGGGLAVRLDTKDILSTDTFFGAFYRSYWFEYAGMQDVSLVVELSGAAKVTVFEDAGRGAEILAVERFRSTSARRFLIDLAPSQLRLTAGETEARPSRLFVEVMAEKTSDVYSIDFVTTKAPLRHATLSIGLCTFNQEAYFARTLTRVARLAASSDAIRAVHVVNQGTSFKNEVIRGLLTAPKIEPVEQRNLGGCGGFTRGLVEELAATSPASHHLMMDDDIVLDERMILRAMRFLDYADREIAVGAAMLDSMRPNIMYEAGAFLRNDNTIHPYCHNVDLSDPGKLWFFNTPVKTDYNAWWFCILPVERARELALPAPVFIRGDDFEYGQRLARAGVPTVTLPGIGVWHEPFYAKPTGWQNYYDLRNRLIFGATYGDKVRQLSLAHVLGLITSAILTHNYMTAELRIRAVNDFLLGPKKLFGTDPEVIHKGIMALAKQDAPEKLDAGWKMNPLTPGKTRPTSMRKLVVDQFFSMLKTGFGPLRSGGDAVLMDADAHPGNTAGRSYVLTNGPRSYHLRFAPRRFRMWGMMFRAALLAQRYRARRTTVGAAWAAHIADYRKPSWWEGTFGPATAASAVIDAVKSDAPAQISDLKTANDMVKTAEPR